MLVKAEFPEDVKKLQAWILKERHVFADPVDVINFWQWRSGDWDATWLMFDRPSTADIVYLDQWLAKHPAYMP